VRELLKSLWELAEGVWGVFIPSLTKTSRWRKGTRILRVYVRILRTLSPDIPDRDQEICRWWKGTQILWVYVRIVWMLSPNIWDIDSETPVLAKTLSKYYFEVVFVAQKYLYGFSWALVLSQNLQSKIPLDSTGFLYSKIKQKSTLQVNLNHRFFISFWGVVLHHIFCLFNFSTCTQAR
jgi:hypothetical protein